MRLSLLMILIPAGCFTSAVYAHATQGGKATAASSDCSADYGQPASCVKVSCPQIYSDFIGTWSGQFYAYERKKSEGGKSVYRPYRNTTVYSPEDCLSNPMLGDTFIVGHQTDDYPAFEDLPGKVAAGLLITGRGVDGTPFLRTVGKDGSHDFAQVYRNTAAKLVIWRLSMPAKDGNPPMTFTTIDARDYSVSAGATRDVTVTMSVGPADAPYWEGVIAHGSHSKAPSP